MTDADHVTQAAELAERIVDEVASAHQDWQRIAHWARELSGIADEAAAAAEDGE